MTLIITLTDTQITIAWIVYLITWVILFLYARRWSKKTIKKMHHAHKDNTVTFLVLDDVPGRYVDIQYSEQPWCELHRHSN